MRPQEMNSTPGELKLPGVFRLRLGVPPMPNSAPKPCRRPGCRELVYGGGNWCDSHRKERVVPGSFSDRHRGSRHARGYGSQWDKLRKRILERDCGLCLVCQAEGRLTAATMVDHIINKAAGGTDDEENLQSICRECHVEKTAREARRGRGVCKV